MKCDKCLSEIIDNECSCGIWYKHSYTPDFVKLLERCILQYDSLLEQNKICDPLGMDHYSGISCVLFKGDYEMCHKVEEYIKSLKNELV
jgi:hypothetical protein